MTRSANRGLRGAWAFLAWLALAMFAVQPAAAAVHSQAMTQTLVVEVCSTHGGKTIAIQLPATPGQKSECAKCPSCLAAPAVLAAPAIAAPGEVARYQPLAYAADRSSCGLRLPRVRPPGQGPPAAPEA